MKYLSVFLIFFFLTELALYSQPQKFSFSGDLEKLPGEMNTVMGAGNLSSEDDFI
jgi:hypothetical protein